MQSNAHATVAGANNGSTASMHGSNSNAERGDIPLGDMKKQADIVYESGDVSLRNVDAPSTANTDYVALPPRTSGYVPVPVV